ncbi:MAG: thiamine pyrophosphate-binding protein, partial [Vicinamibacteria bacterium]
MQKKMELGDYLVGYLKKIGVTHLFGIPGDLVLHLFHRFARPRGMKIITLSHEPGVGFAADAYARSTGRLGVVCVTYGAGGHNIVNALAGAYAEKVPLLVVSGGPGEEERKLGTLIHHQAKEIESQFRIFQELTCDAAIVDDPRTAPEIIDRVTRSAWLNRRPGYIEIHRDMVQRTVAVPKEILDWDGILPEQTSDKRKVLEAARDTAENFNRAKKPALIVGIECYRYHLAKEIIELAEKLGAPVFTTVLSKGAFPMSHPLYMGVHVGPISPPAIAKRIEEADLVLSLGTLLTDINLGTQAPQVTRAKSVWALNNRVNVSFHTYTEVTLRDFVRALLDSDVKTHKEKVTYHDNLHGEMDFDEKGPVKVAGILAELNRHLK